MDSSAKLNIFQRGILQKCATVFVYFASITIGALVIDWLDKWLFIRLAEQAKNQKLLSPEATRGFTLLIEARDSTVIFAIVLVGLACGFAGWIFMRWAAKRNWSWPTILPKAVEFRAAMERLGITDPADRIAFVRKHKLSVFIALSPLIGKEHEAVRAKLYAFAHHSSLGDNDVFERHTGKQTLCLSADDFERLLQEHGQKIESALPARIVELEKAITDLQVARSLQNADIAKLTEENASLREENTEFRNKLRTVPGREGKTETSTHRRIPFWRVAGPLINRLIDEAQPGTQYSRSDIQAAFDAEVKKFPDLKSDIKKELHLTKQKEPESEFDLSGWGMDAIRAALGNLAKTDPGPSRKR